MPMTFKRNGLGKVRTPPTGKEHVQRCVQVFLTQCQLQEGSHEKTSCCQALSVIQRESMWIHVEVEEMQSLQNITLKRMLFAFVFPLTIVYFEAINEG